MQWTEEVRETAAVFSDLESLGIVGTENTLYDDFYNTVTVQDGRYEVSLPWRNVHKTHSAESGYNSIIQDQLKQAIMELVPDPDSALGMCHHIPHHAVVHQDKSTTSCR